MEKRIFLSYSWEDTADANQLDNLFARFQIRLTRDIRDLTYNTNIHRFMDTLKQHDKLILLVSDSYLRSVNCMYEASQVLEMQEKTVILLKKDTRLFGIEDKAALINFWQNKLQTILQMDPLLYRQELADTQIACQTIGAFVDYIKQDNRMNVETLDFDVLIENLQLNKSYPTIVTKTVMDWIAQTPQAKLFDVLALIHDLYRSQSISFSEFPNIPDHETVYLFQRIQFERDINGINLYLTVTDRKAGKDLAIIYPHLVSIQENSHRSVEHAKYHFQCENPAKKQQVRELSSLTGLQMLTEEEQSLISSGYLDTYRILIHFHSFDPCIMTLSEG